MTQFGGSSAETSVQLDGNSHSSERADATQTAALALVEALCGELDAASVDYCHWKSTTGLARSASGDTDLDLLVRREHGTRFNAILASLGFKGAREDPVDELPGVLHAYGLDAETLCLVHLHVHYQLPLGHDRTKNYRLPIEDLVLASSRPAGPLRIPSPEVELVMLVVRFTLKYSTWDAILTGLGQLRRGDRVELDDLCSRVDSESMRETRRELLPTVSDELFDACRTALENGQPGWRRARAGARLQRALGIYARGSHARDVTLKLTRRVRLGLRSRLGRPRRRRPARGGAMICVVGGDGAGKSTAIAELERWLGDEFDVRSVHLGKPPWSLLTRTVRGSLKALRLGRRARMRPAGAARSWNELAWLLCTARDRKLAYRRARRFESNGAIVLCDRFPLEQLQLMDGPQIARVVGSEHETRLTRWMSRIEETYYTGMRAPELVIVLRVPPELAVQRKTDEGAEYVHARSSAVWSVDWTDTHVQVIDAAQPRPRVFAELKSLVWQAL